MPIRSAVPATGATASGPERFVLTRLEAARQSSMRRYARARSTTWLALGSPENSPLGQKIRSCASGRGTDEQKSATSVSISVSSAYAPPWIRSTSNSTRSTTESHRTRPQISSLRHRDPCAHRRDPRVSRRGPGPPRDTAGPSRARATRSGQRSTHEGARRSDRSWAPPVTSDPRPRGGAPRRGRRRR